MAPLNNDLINLFKSNINKYDAVVFVDYNKDFLIVLILIS